MSTILVVDNYDSFVYNLVQYIGQLTDPSAERPGGDPGTAVQVRRNDAVTPSDLDALDVCGVLISPGPGTPDGAGVSMQMVRACAERSLPLFGVCLGHQAVGAVFGAPVVRAPELVHGKTSEVHHDGAGVLAGLPSPFTATRYHSLVVEASALPSEIEVTGWTASGVVMALRHRSLPIDGVQFHPESVLTHGGHRIVANWLGRCGFPVDPARVESLAADVDAMRAGAFTSPSPASPVPAIIG
jgi:para-aminobenzoate synthetase component 2